jgi:hypothetical protein
VRNRRIQAARAVTRLERCETCRKPTRGAAVQHFSYSERTKTTSLVKVECTGCDLRARMVEYRKTKQLDNKEFKAAIQPKSSVGMF